MTTPLEDAFDDATDAMIDLMATMRRVKKFGLMSPAGNLMKEGTNYDALRRAMDKVSEAMAQVESRAIHLKNVHWKHKEEQSKPKGEHNDQASY